MRIPKSLSALGFLLVCGGLAPAHRAAAEEAYMRSVVAYNVALFTVERAAGTLLSVRDISAHRMEPKTSDGLEEIIVTTPATGVPAGAGVDILQDPEGTRAAD